MSEKYICNDCGKKFRDNAALTRHMDRKTKCIDKISTSDNKCRNCGKVFTGYSSLYYHIKHNVCGTKSNILIDKSKNINTTNNTHNNFNQSNNVEVQGDVKVVKFGNENLSYISDDMFKKIIGRGFKSLGEFMDHVHFNKDHPENHNIYVASVKDGYVITYDGKSWTMGTADEVMSELIQRKSDILEEKYDEILDMLSPMEVKKFSNFINRKDDNRIMMKLKRELRVQLYNNRHFAKANRKLIESCQHKELPRSESDDSTSELNDLINSIKNVSGVDDDKIMAIRKLLNV